MPDLRRPVLLAVVALAATALAQHQHGEHAAHKVAAAARMEVVDDPAARILTLRLGPLELPAGADHLQVAQPPSFFLEVPFDGWMIAYHPRLVDPDGNLLPSRLLHHVAFWHTGRPDFLCPNKLEHVFGAGGEMNDWPALPGVGYRVYPGDRIRVDTMFHNPTPTAFPAVYLEVKVEYRRAGEEQLASVYPAWFDVQKCGNSGYDLPVGKAVRSAEFTLAYGGKLLGVGGHMHDHGRQMELVDVGRNRPLASLAARLDPSGQIVSMPVVVFPDGGYALRKGDRLRVTATYDNPTGMPLPQGAMGIVVGYLLPEDDAELDKLRR